MKLKRCCQRKNITVIRRYTIPVSRSMRLIWGQACRQRDSRKASTILCVLKLCIIPDCNFTNYSCMYSILLACH